MNDLSDVIDFTNMELNNGFRPVDEIPEPYRDIFANYCCFNAVQSRVLDEVLYTDNSLVVAAPTGSGKTVIFELAIVRFLCEGDLERNNKIVYLSPLKALCEERLIDWQRKFSRFNINCVSVNGDTENIDFNFLMNFHIIIATPEKWDVLTRKWRSNENVIGLVKLFLIDEIHMLNTDVRGSTLEVTVCRMKSIDKLLNQSERSNRKTIRFLALSATVPNIDDVAEWIGQSKNTKSFHFSEDMRPVKLNKIVLGYPFNIKAPSAFKFDYSLNYKLQHLMLQYSNGKPVLIFCSTRKSAEMTADFIVQNVKINLNLEQKQVLEETSMQIASEKMKSYVRHGVAFHHAGLNVESRHKIEDCFRCGHLPILVTTSTLALGVNLPAHLVIIKSTKAYDKGWRDYNETEIFQMIGRAGRPQFDTSATAVILTTRQDKERYVNMMGSGVKVESNLHHHFTEHLNAEVVLGTINDLDVAMQWLTSTFLYIRARKNPIHYNLSSGLNADQIDKKLLDMCHIDLNKLVSGGMLEMNENIEIFPTAVGKIMAKYYVSFETMKLFSKMTGNEILLQILETISKCGEFFDIRLRVADKKVLNLFNKNSNKENIRFPLKGKINSANMKVNCIIQSVLGNLDISIDHSLSNDSQTIMRQCSRVIKCLIEYLHTKTHCYTALLNAIILAKCFEARMWENSPYVSKQLTGIGNVLSRQLVKAGKTNFQLISETNPRQIEMIIKRKAPFGATILEEIKHLPVYEMKLAYSSGSRTVTLSVTLNNVSVITEKSTINVNSYMILLVGDEENKILVYDRYSHSYMMEKPKIVKTFAIEPSYQGHIQADFISENWVGIDCTSKIPIENPCPRKTVEENTEKVSTKTYMQTFLDTFLNHTSRNQSNKEEVIRNKENSNPNKKAVKKTINATPKKKKPNKTFSISNGIYGKVVKRKVDQRKNEIIYVKTPTKKHGTPASISRANINQNNLVKMNNLDSFKSNNRINTIHKPDVSIKEQPQNSCDDIFESFADFLKVQNNNNNSILNFCNEASNITADNMEESPVLNKIKPHNLTDISTDTEIKSKYDSTLIKNSLVNNKQSLEEALQATHTKTTLKPIKVDMSHTKENISITNKLPDRSNSDFLKLQEGLSAKYGQAVQTENHSCSQKSHKDTQLLLKNVTKVEDMPKCKGYISDSSKSKTFSHTIAEIIVPNKKTKFSHDTSQSSSSNSSHNKGISWRSPLIHSPGIKFSPKNLARDITERGRLHDSVDEKTNETLESSDTSTGCTVNLTLNVKDTPKLIHSHWRSAKTVRQLPLCDSDAREGSLETLNTKNTTGDNSFRKYLRFYDIEGSTQRGTSENNPLRSVDGGTSSVTDYYSQLLSERTTTRKPRNNGSSPAKYQCPATSENGGQNTALGFFSPVRGSSSRKDNMKSCSLINDSQAVGESEVDKENFYNSRRPYYEDVNGLINNNSVQRFPLQFNSKDFRIPSTVPSVCNMERNIGFPYQNNLINQLVDTNTNISQNYRQTRLSSEELDRYLQGLDQSELSSSIHFRQYQNPPNLLYGNRYTGRDSLNQLEFLDHPYVQENRYNPPQMWHSQHSTLPSGMSSYSPTTGTVPVVMSENQLPMTQWGYYNYLPHKYSSLQPTTWMICPPNQTRYSANTALNGMLVNNQENFNHPSSYNNYQMSLNENSFNAENRRFIKPGTSITNSESNSNNLKNRQFSAKDLNTMRAQSSSQNIHQNENQTGRKANVFSDSCLAEDYHKNKKQVVLHDDSFDDRLNEMTPNANTTTDYSSVSGSQFVQNRTAPEYLTECSRFGINQNNNSFFYSQQDPRQRFPLSRELGNDNHILPSQHRVDTFVTQRYLNSGRQDY